MKNTKTLAALGGLAIVLTMLLGAGSASAAQFRAPSYPVSLSGEALAIPAMEMTTATGISKCATMTLSGTATGASSSISVTPSYSGCKAFGVKASLNMNSCSYVLNSTNEVSPFTGTADISCSKAGDAIEISPEGMNCKVKLPAQKGLAGAEFVNGSSFTKVFLGLAGLKYSEEGSGCAAAGEHTTSSYHSDFLVTGIRLRSLVAPKFQGEKYPVLVSGSGSVSMSFSSGSVNCSTLPQGTMSGASATLNLSPQIYGCYLGAKFSIKENGCYLTLAAGANEFPYVAGTLGVGCAEPGSALSFVTPLTNCEVRIPAQSGKPQEFENTGAGTARGINVKLAVSGLQYTETGAGCSAPGAHSDLALGGTFSLSGFQSEGGLPGARQGIWVS
jgi:hypothetical protein